MIYETGVELGSKYRDKITGWEGTASAVYFWAHSGPSVQLERLSKDGSGTDVMTFSAGRLTADPAEEGKGEYL